MLCVVLMLALVVSSFPLMFGVVVFMYSSVRCLFCVSRVQVLMANWDGFNLAENLFSAIGVRVVDVLHS